MVETPEMPEGPFDVLYADPPWRYDDGTTTPDNEIENHYPTMELESIKALDVPAADDAILYLWTTAPHLESGLEVLRAWGFEYKTGAVWHKTGGLGLGHYFRVDHEHLLVGVRGSGMTPDDGKLRSSVFTVDKGAHSVKPTKVRAHIEQAHPDADRVELFSRDGLVGWTMWGNDVAETRQERLRNYGDRA